MAWCRSGSPWPGPAAIRASAGRYRRGRRTRPIVNLLSVGTLTPRKGHDLLIEALARLADLPWTCRIIGSPDRAPATAADLRARIARHGLQSRIILAGETADLSAAYGAADVFVLASRHEGYGMVFAEAMQHGLPIIATTAGAIPEAVPSGAGILVPPDDVAALAGALAQLIRDPALRARYAAGRPHRGPRTAKLGGHRARRRCSAAPLRDAGCTAGRSS